MTVPTYPKVLIIGPMTSGKTTFLERAGLPPSLLVDGDFPFTIQPRFKEVWSAYCAKPRVGELWQKKDMALLERYKVWGLVTHQSLPLARLGLRLGYNIFVLLPIDSPGELAERWSVQRRDWVDSWEGTSVLPEATKAWDTSLKIARMPRSVLIRRHDEADRLADVLRQAVTEAGGPEMITSASQTNQIDQMTRSRIAAELMLAAQREMA